MPADIQDLQPEFRDRIYRMLNASGIPYHIISGYRDPALQQKLYANYQAKKAGQALPYPQEGSGGVAAPPGGSFHNYGLAADALANDPSQQQALINFANAHPEYGIHSLGAFDPPHFQMAGNLSDLINQYHINTGGVTPPMLAQRGTGPVTPRAGPMDPTIAAGGPGTTLNTTPTGATAAPVTPPAQSPFQMMQAGNWQGALGALGKSGAFDQLGKALGSDQQKAQIQPMQAPVIQPNRPQPNPAMLQALMQGPAMSGTSPSLMNRMMMPRYGMSISGSPFDDTQGYGYA